MARFSFLHVSDFHLANIPYQIGFPDWLIRYPKTIPLSHKKYAVSSSHDPNLVHAFVLFAFQNRQNYDALILSGDLSTTGQTPDLQCAVDLIDSTPIHGFRDGNGNPTLKATGKNCLLLPGNHDRFDIGNVPGNTNFETMLQQYWSVGQSAQILGVFPEERPLLAFVGADFSLRRGDVGDLAHVGLGQFGQGRVYDEVLQELVRLSHKLRKQHPRCEIVWVFHFEPEARHGLLKLLDVASLSRVIRRQRILAILCGHTHEAYSKMFRNVPVFVCGTTAEYFAPAGNSVQRINIELDPKGVDRPKINVRRFHYDSTSKIFQP